MPMIKPKIYHWLQWHSWLLQPAVYLKEEGKQQFPNCSEAMSYVLRQRKKSNSGVA